MRKYIAFLSILVSYAGTLLGASATATAKDPIEITQNGQSRSLTGSTTDFHWDATNYCTYPDANRGANQVCRTDQDAGFKYCEPDPYSRICAYYLVADHGQSNLYCTTCAAGSSPPPRPPQVVCDNSNPVDCPSPIILNLGRSDYHLTDVQHGVSFDLTADGSADIVSWTAAGELLAFLAMDRNANGKIDDGSELFGNYTRLTDGSVASNGFEALAELDSNGDHVIDARDAKWGQLLLWIDRNHDGASTPEELTPIASSEVTGVQTAYQASRRRDRFGNMFKYQGTARIRGFNRECFDIYFVEAP